MPSKVGWEVSAPASASARLAVPSMLQSQVDSALGAPRPSRETHWRDLALPRSFQFDNLNDL